MATNLPRGIRNNNPGNIEWGDPWQGLANRSTATDKRFAQFTAPVWGIRALARTLVTYYDKYGIKSVRQAINRWAPPVENNTNAYVNQVAKAVGVHPDDRIDFHDYAVMKPMLEAIIRHENGQGPLTTANTWYKDDEIIEGLKLAGYKPPVKEVVSMPVTKETASATGLTAVGLVEIAPTVLSAVRDNQDKLTSDSIMSIVVGVVIIGLAIVIAYSQFRKKQKDML